MESNNEDLDSSFTEEDLESITRVAAAAYSPKEAAFILGFPVKKFTALVKNEDTRASMAYYKGLYSSELAVRESIMLMARNASSPAHTMANNLFNENRLNLIKCGFPAANED